METLDFWDPECEFRAGGNGRRVDGDRAGLAASSARMVPLLLPLMTSHHLAGIQIIVCNYSPYFLDCKSTYPLPVFQKQRSISQQSFDAVGQC
jgi:hypothetical protein